MELTLYYSVSNGGDGSAYPQFSLSKDLVDIHQEMESELRGEGWGEDCVGEITLTSDSPITVSERYNKSLITKESIIKSLGYYLEGGYRKSESVKARAQKFLDRVNEL